MGMFDTFLGDVFFVTFLFPDQNSPSYQLSNYMFWEGSSQSFLWASSGITNQIYQIILDHEIFVDEHIHQSFVDILPA